MQVALQEVVRDVISSCDYGLKTDMEGALNGLRGYIGILRNRDRKENKNRYNTTQLFDAIAVVVSSCDADWPQRKFLYQMMS